MLKLLVVDDERDVCDFVKNFFKERNFEVFVAYDGKEAISSIGSNIPDIVLLDIKMPGMDGIETLKTIRKIDNKVKVIMISAVEDLEKIEEAKRLGATEYITKPLLLEQLERAVFIAAEQIRVTVSELSSLRKQGSVKIDSRLRGNDKGD